MTRVSNRRDKITTMCKCNPITSNNTIPTKKEKKKELRKDEIMV